MTWLLLYLLLWLAFRLILATGHREQGCRYRHHAPMVRANNLYLSTHQKVGKGRHGR